MTLWERFRLRPVVAPLFKCEHTIKAIGNFYEVTPIKRPLCGSCHFITVSQGVLNIYLSYWKQKVVQIKRLDPNITSFSEVWGWCQLCKGLKKVDSTCKYLLKTNSGFFGLRISTSSSQVLCGLQLGKATENILLCRCSPQTYTCLDTYMYHCIEHLEEKKNPVSLEELLSSVYL